MANPVQELVRIATDLQRRVANLERREGSPLTVPSNLVLASDAVTVLRPYHTLEPQTGTTDDLSTVNGGRDGMVITFRVKDLGDTITVKDGTGNLRLASDFAMDSQQDTIQLIYDATLDLWLELCRSSNA